MSQLELTFLDVQHGSACHIATPSGKNFMFDLGTGDFDKSQGGEDHSPLVYLKKHRGVNVLDGVIITHPHRDHIDDIFNFHTLTPKAFWRPNHLTEENIRAGNKPGDSAKIDRYLQISASYSGGFAPGADPTDVANNGCTQFDVFWVTTPSQSNLNNHSLAAVVAFAGTKILLTGDQESAAWQELLSKPRFVAAAKGTDVLLASHHGRASGYSSELFDAIGNPCLTIISDTNPGDTCVRDKYTAKSTGWVVRSRTDPDYEETRYCLTTRGDGTIQMQCGHNSGHGTYRAVTRR